jgi:hypothetical protein
MLLHKQVNKLQGLRIVVPQAVMWTEIAAITKDGLRGG